uniref:Odorant-binding protein 99a n=1 Tax=Drosophila melanogaster TaxID=7227 RepID=D1FYI8_DROME|nr:odorant-binding protein 99a [Drosophila melanogaster]ABW78228.1 odorant-binding protein 99a [Drosophila melanogaster]ABW78240.1 odorant-binding protein 99a [Drosophila melanogaster]ABW78243.1 odorant-binding protein 99a [Drosophila melanogaster]ABW78244.1 odorant-binding protein 99a [Drosophila melanogaster]
MKVFVAICVLIGLASADYVVKNRHDMLAYRDECVKELAVPVDLVEKYQRWEYPNDAKTQCYIKCVFTKWGLFDVQSGFNVENIHQQLVGNHADHNEAFHASLAACVDKNEQGSNACEWAYRGATCLLKENLAQIQKSLAPKA